MKEFKEKIHRMEEEQKERRSQIKRVCVLIRFSEGKENRGEAIFKEMIKNFKPHC